jgi:hypothetical protein
MVLKLVNLVSLFGLKILKVDWLAMGEITGCNYSNFVE